MQSLSWKTTRFNGEYGNYKIILHFIASVSQTVPALGTSVLLINAMRIVLLVFEFVPLLKVKTI